MRNRLMLGVGLAVLVTLGACSEQEKPAEAAAPIVDSEALLLDQASAIHAQVLVLDAHADIEIPGKISRYAGADGRSEVAPDKMAAGGMDAVVLAAAVGPGPRNAEGYAAARTRADEEIAAVQAMAADPQNNVVIATTADEVLAAHDAGKMSVILGFQNALIIGEDVSGFDDFYNQGVRVFALTHMGHNDYADSSRPLFISATGEYEPVAEHGGLSSLGQQAIERINSLGGVVDVTQLSRDATLQAVSLSTTPVIASHSNVQTLSDVSRNLSDEEIDAIAAAGGVVHIAAFIGYLFDSSDAQLDADIRAARREAGLPEDYLYPFELYWELDDPDVQARYLGQVSDLLGPGDVGLIVNHIDYLVQRVGIDHVGIGNDFNHGGGIGGFTDASEALNLTIGMLRRGYSADDIRKIWGGNFLRVFRIATQGG